MHHKILFKDDIALIIKYYFEFCLPKTDIYRVKCDGIID